jgi:hypothetical protein
LCTNRLKTDWIALIFGYFYRRLRSVVGTCGCGPTV